VADELLSPHRDHRLLLHEIERTPVGTSRRSQHEQMCAGIVRDDLFGSRADEIGEPRIRNLDRRMQRADRVKHLLHGVGLRSRRQVGRHAKGEFGLGDAHFVSRHRSRAAIGDDGFGQDASGHRAVDIDVLLPGFAGGRDLPAEQFCLRIALDSFLDRVGFSAAVRPQRVFEARELGARAPMIVQRP